MVLDRHSHRRHCSHRTIFNLCLRNDLQMDQWPLQPHQRTSCLSEDCKRLALPLLVVQLVAVVVVLLLLFKALCHRDQRRRQVWPSCLQLMRHRRQRITRHMQLGTRQEQERESTRDQTNLEVLEGSTHNHSWHLCPRRPTLLRCVLPLPSYLCKATRQLLPPVLLLLLPLVHNQRHKQVCL